MSLDSRRDASELHFVEIRRRHPDPTPAGEGLAERARRDLGLDPGAVVRSRLLVVAAALAPGELERFAAAVADPVLDEVSVDAFAPLPHRAHLVVARRAGVTCDEGAEAQRLLADLLDRPGLAAGRRRVFALTVHRLERALGAAELERLAALLGNPLVDRTAAGAVLAALPFDLGGGAAPAAAPAAAEISLERDDAALLRLSRERTLALSLAELRRIRDHHRDPAVAAARRAAGLPAGPTDVELEALAQSWSEHCRHKLLDAEIDFVDEERGERRRIDSLFATAIRATTAEIRARLAPDFVVTAFGDNAGVVRVDDERLLAVKVETHNSPSALDPYGGALTGLLGVYRDLAGVGHGGAELLCGADVLGFAPPGERELLPGQLHPRQVAAGVCRGIADAGNLSGVPTVAGAVVYDESYAGKPLVFCGALALLPAAVGGRPAEEKRILPGDRVVMAGGRVGRDGIHGATFSSTTLDESSPRTAVQIGSPITQRRLFDFLGLAARRGLVRAVTDNGAGGLSSSVGELARLSGGAEIDLLRVPRKADGLAAWEVLVSESQERMTLAVPPERLDELVGLAAHLEVEASDLGAFTACGSFVVRDGGRLVAALPLALLDSPPRLALEAVWRPPPARTVAPSPAPPGETLLRLLGSLDISSREGLIRRLDHGVGGRTVLGPLAGRGELVPEDGAVLELGPGRRGVALAHGLCPRLGALDPWLLGAAAFDEAVRHIVALGGRLPAPGVPGFLAACDNLCVPDSIDDPAGNPDGREKLGRLVRALDGLAAAARAFLVPLVSGKDSTQNDLRAGGRKISILPTVLVTAVGSVADVARVPGAELRRAGDLLYLVGPTAPELGGSCLLGLDGERGGPHPRLDLAAAAARYHRLGAAIGDGLVESCHDLGDGGLLVAAAEATFDGVGAALDVADDGLELAAALFAETPSRFLISVRPGREAALVAAVPEAHRVGVAGGERLRLARGGRVLLDLGIDELLAAWRRGPEGIS